MDEGTLTREVEGTTATMRRASVSDAELLHQWRNDPAIVSLSTSQRLVGWEEHRTWLERTLADPQVLLLIVLVDGQPAGQVRFQPEAESSSNVSIYLMPPFADRGLGSLVLRSACRLAFEQLGSRRIVAFIRSDNARSLRAFVKAGFRRAKHSAPPAHDAFELERE